MAARSRQMARPSSTSSSMPWARSQSAWLRSCAATRKLVDRHLAGDVLLAEARADAHPARGPDRCAPSPARGGRPAPRSSTRSRGDHPPARAGELAGVAHPTGRTGLVGDAGPDPASVERAGRSWARAPRPRRPPRPPRGPLPTRRRPARSGRTGGCRAARWRGRRTAPGREAGRRGSRRSDRRPPPAPRPRRPGRAGSQRRRPAASSGRCSACAARCPADGSTST